MNFSPGLRLGPYELLERIGSGGMGEVYRAQDTRLNRVVAVKVLLGTVAEGSGADPGLLRRFEQEARTLAALNHPNILAVHDIGTYEGAPYLVSEFLEGETLRAKLNSGPLPVRRAIEYVLGIADGLAAGHSKGVVHRDIKPANIFLTRDGRIKILDFGLAKLVTPGGGVENVETLLTREDGTAAGTVLGTVGYMSPEQVRGEPAAATSDIFSFGAVFYEMLSGKRAFKRDSAAETMTAILREEPPELASAGWNGPPALQRIVERCLEKNPERRFQSASDLSFAIESVSGLGSGVSSGTAVASAKKKPGMRTVAWMAAVIALCMMGVGGWWLGRKMSSNPVPVFKQVTFQSGSIPAARFTRDGDTVVYAGQFDMESMQIYSMRPGNLQPVRVDVPSAMLLAVSRSDQMLASMDPQIATTYMTGTLAEVPVTGGAPRLLKDNVLSADYAPDGKAIAATRYLEGKCRLEFPLGKMLYETSGYLDYVRVSPDGKTVAFAEHDIVGDDRGWVTVADNSGKVRRLTKQYDSLQGLAWRPDGSEIWFTSSAAGTGVTLSSVGLSGKVRDILAVPGTVWLEDIAANGQLLLTSVSELGRITAFDGATGEVTPNLLELNETSMVSDVSRDGKAMVYEEDDEPTEGQYHVLYRKTDGSPPLMLGVGTGPQLSPDGKTVAALLFGTPMKIVFYPLGTGESRTLGMSQVVTATNILWFPDGRRLAVMGAEEGKAQRTYVVNVENGVAEAVGPEGFQVAAISPDGKRLVGAIPAAGDSSASDPRSGVTGSPAIVDLTTNEVNPVTGMVAGERIVAWSPDGAGLLLESFDKKKATITRVDLATAKKTLVKQVDTGGQGAGGWSVLWLAADEKSYVLFQIAQTGTLWTVDGVK